MEKKKNSRKIKNKGRKNRIKIENWKDKEKKISTYIIQKKRRFGKILKLGKKETREINDRGRKSRKKTDNWKGKENKGRKKYYKG